MSETPKSDTLAALVEARVDAIKFRTLEDEGRAWVRVDRVRLELLLANDQNRLAAAERVRDEMGTQMLRCIDAAWLNNRAIPAGHIGNVLVEYVDSLRAQLAAMESEAAATNEVLDGYAHAIKQAQDFETELDGVDAEDLSQVYAIVGYWHDKLLALTAARDAAINGEDA